VLRWDEAIFVSVVIVGVTLLGLAGAELLAQALAPVSDALMAGTKEATQVLLKDVN